jgi:hypothetical protein
MFSAHFAICCVRQSSPPRGRAVFLMYCRLTEIGEVGVRKRRSRQEIKRLVREFETSGLRRSEFCHKHNLALGTLQRGLRKRGMEVDGQSESKRLVEVKMAGIQRNGEVIPKSRLNPSEKVWERHKQSDILLPPRRCLTWIILEFVNSKTH